SDLLIDFFFLKSEAEGEGNAVKLCGRDFVRAIVFTCGGSRWKRDLANYQYLFGKLIPVLGVPDCEGAQEEQTELGGASQAQQHRLHPETAQLHICEYVIRASSQLAFLAPHAVLLNGKGTDPGAASHCEEL
uniref:Uncharacterized protein n=1 Tax=Meleagris gallopavo TaxID=9103 RepID=A0A803XPU5_MELGA